ncbi:MAG: DNA polymerase III subunit delta [Phycisphaerales bacterium]|nr:DNA polymerase III subunit delta [Phycisphaerales bacterium]
MAKGASRSASDADRRTVDWASARIVVLHGPDAFMQAEYLRQGREALEKQMGGADAFSTVRFQGEQATLADVLDECRSYDLLQRHKLVIVENAERLINADNRDVMVRYAASPSDLATLVLRAEKWQASGLDKAVAQVGAVIKCESDLTPAKAAGWAVTRALKRHGVTLQPDAAIAIVERTGPEFGRIDAEIAKLATAAGDEPITPALVRQLTARTAEGDNLFDIQGLIATDDPEAALHAVREAVTLWREAPTGVCYAEIDLIRKCHNIARMVESGVPPQAAASKARLWKDKDRILWLASRAPAKRWATLLDWALEMDARCKSGFSDAGTAAETIAVQIASAGNRSGR